jgi:hypothetical protein
LLIRSESSALGLAAWGDKGDEPAGFGAARLENVPITVGPVGVLLDRYDRVWVGSLNDRVQVFIPAGSVSRA